jgi:hypothetical protein
MTTHLVAASIIVPALARRLPGEDADPTDQPG